MLTTANKPGAFKMFSAGLNFMHSADDFMTSTWVLTNSWTTSAIHYLGKTVKPRRKARYSIMSGLAVLSQGCGEANGICRNKKRLCKQVLQENMCTKFRWTTCGALKCKACMEWFKPIINFLYQWEHNKAYKYDKQKPLGV